MASSDHRKLGGQNSLELVAATEEIRKARPTGDSLGRRPGCLMYSSTPHSNLIEHYLCDNCSLQMSLRSLDLNNTTQT